MSSSNRPSTLSGFMMRRAVIVTSDAGSASVCAWTIGAVPHTTVMTQAIRTIERSCGRKGRLTLVIKSVYVNHRFTPECDPWRSAHAQKHDPSLRPVAHCGHGAPGGSKRRASRGTGRDREHFRDGDRFVWL